LVPGGLEHARAAFVSLVLLALCACAAKAIAPQARATRSGGLASGHCDRYGSPGSGRARAGRAHRGRRGSLHNPFRGAQRLVNALRPGQTGCLLGGTYNLGGELRFSHSGRPGRLITLKAFPGARVTLHDGVVAIPHGSDFVTLSSLRIDTAGSDQPGIQVMGAYDRLIYDNVTNDNTLGSCIILGSDTGYGQASHTLILGSVVHQCGYDPANSHEDHGVYVDNSVDATITNNVIWGVPYGWGVQLYPHSVGTTVVRNIINQNGQGVIFAGNGDWTSSGNTVAYNVISGASKGYDIQSWWGGSVGTDNLAQYNCLFNHGRREIQRPTRGFAASHNVVAPPHYSNAAEHDYALRSHSRCRPVVGYTAIDAG
jgi:hypothetical protein